MSYEQGFAQGERDAWMDRRIGLPLERGFAEPATEYAQGYEDGYTPRRADWWRVSRPQECAA